VPAKPTAPPKPAATGVLAAPVLGGLKASWIAARGNPTGGVIGDLFRPGTEVAWARDAAGADRAQHIELLLPAAVPVGQARDQAKALHPSDARLVRTYVAPAGQTVEVFESSLLAEAFAGATQPAIGSRPPASVFGDAPAGTYIQIAERGSPTTSRVVLGLGDNP
jgi:hypothetical protein